MAGSFKRTFSCIEWSTVLAGGVYVIDGIVTGVLEEEKKIMMLGTVPQAMALLFLCSSEIHVKLLCKNSAAAVQNSYCVEEVVQEINT